MAKVLILLGCLGAGLEFIRSRNLLESKVLTYIGIWAGIIGIFAGIVIFIGWLIGLLTKSD